MMAIAPSGFSNATPSVSSNSRQADGSRACSNEPRLMLDEVRRVIRSRGLNNLAVPREIKVLRELPRLGTGKINHRELEKLA